MIPNTLADGKNIMGGEFFLMQLRTPGIGKF
jgi:hypothetical protein